MIEATENVQVVINDDTFCDEYIFNNTFCEFRHPIPLKFVKKCISLKSTSVRIPMLLLQLKN